MNQFRVTEWVRKIFTEAEATNAPERSLRVVEEAIELAQACGIDAETIHRIVDYVCSRPIGEAPKEIAGCLVTVYATAAALGVDAQSEFEIELSRIHQPEVIDRVRRRQQEKRAALVTKDPVVRPIEDLPGARASSGLEGPKKTHPTNVDDLTSDEQVALSYIAPNLACVIEREPPKEIEETRRLAREELAWIMRRSSPLPTRIDALGAPVCGCGRLSTHQSGWCGRECEAKFGDKVILVRDRTAEELEEEIRRTTRARQIQERGR